MTVLVQILGPRNEVDAVRDELRDHFGPCIKVNDQTYPDGTVAHWCGEITVPDGVVTE